MKELIEELDKETLYYKIESDKEIEKEFNITEFPSLLIFKGSRLLGKVEGYYSQDVKRNF